MQAPSRPGLRGCKLIAAIQDGCRNRELLLFGQRADHPGENFTLVKLRNAVAHGEDVRRFPKLNRLTVDAVKRTLVLEDDPPLSGQIAKLWLPPNPSNKGCTT